jgi:hypothetical protein
VAQQVCAHGGDLGVRTHAITSLDAHFIQVHTPRPRRVEVAAHEDVDLDRAHYLGEVAQQARGLTVGSIQLEFAAIGVQTHLGGRQRAVFVRALAR